MTNWSADHQWGTTSSASKTINRNLASSLVIAIALLVLLVIALVLALAYNAYRNAQIKPFPMRGKLEFSLSINGAAPEPPVRRLTLTSTASTEKHSANGICRCPSSR